MKYNKDNLKLLGISIVSLITTFSMFNKLKYDYSMLEHYDNYDKYFKGVIPYNDNVQLKIIDYFNMFQYEYIIGMIILLFLTLISLQMTYDIYKKLKTGDTNGKH